MKDLKTKIEQAVEDAYLKAEKFYNKKFPRVPVRYDLRGTCAGQSLTRRWLKFNLQVALDNFDKYIDRTPAHEVAHQISKIHYGDQIKPHGREWKYVMTQVMKIPADRCHQFDVSKSRTTKSCPVKCACGEKTLGITRYKRMLSGEASYYCKNCKCALQPAESNEPLRKAVPMSRKKKQDPLDFFFGMGDPRADRLPQS